MAPQGQSRISESGHIIECFRGSETPLWLWGGDSEIASHPKNRSRFGGLETPGTRSCVQKHRTIRFYTWCFKSLLPERIIPATERPLPNPLRRGEGAHLKFTKAFAFRFKMLSLGRGLAATKNSLCGAPLPCSP